MKKLLLALLLAAPYALLAGGAALWLHSEPWIDVYKRQRTYSAAWRR